VEGMEGVEGIRDRKSNRTGGCWGEK
jgi:hypothetical protein